MKMVTVEFHSRTRQILFWTSVCVIIIVVVLGPFLATAFIANGQVELAQTKRAAQASQRAAQSADRAAQGTQQLLQYAESLQSGPNRAATIWYIREFEAICTSNPRCHPVPMPPSMQQQLAGGS